MSEEAPLAGLFAALPTPLDDKRQLDVKALEYLTDYLAARRLAGLALFTDAAEDLVLGGDERKVVLKHVAAKLRRRGALAVVVSAVSSSEAAELAKLARGKGAEAVLLAWPKLPGLGYRELYRHVDRVAKASDAPLFLVSRPGCALEALSPEELTALLAHPSIRGVQALHASGEQLDEWAKRLKPRVGALVGGAYLDLERHGARGVGGAICAAATIASAQAVAPEKLSNAERAALEGLVELVGPAASGGLRDGVQRLAVKLAKRPLEGPGLPSAYAFGLVKEALRLQGIAIRPEVRPPFEVPRPEQLERLRGFLAALRLVAAA